MNISSYARLQTAKHLIDDPDITHQYSPIVIEERAWIAEGAVVLGGVTIGEAAVVAANAVVTKDVEPFHVVGGVPLKSSVSAPASFAITSPGARIGCRHGWGSPAPLAASAVRG